MTLIWINNRVAGPSVMLDDTLAVVVIAAVGALLTEGVTEPYRFRCRQAKVCSVSTWVDS